MRITFVGDFFAKNPMRIQFDPTLIELIQSSDYAVCNFEAPVDFNLNPIIKSGPSLAQPKESVQVLKQLGFNRFGFANNHAMDFGEEGLKSTLELFNIDETLGAGSFSDAYKVNIISKNGINVGLLSLCQHEFGITESLNNKYGVSWINDPIVDDIVGEWSKKLDALIIISHAGLEDIDIPLPQWRQRYRHLIDLGASCIIGGHPHVPQGREMYKDRPIYYSLGNFFFESNKMKNNPHRHSLVVSLDVTKEKILDTSYVSQCPSTPDDLRVSLLTSEACEKYVSSLNEKLDSSKYSKILDSVVENWGRIYRFQYEFSKKRISLKFIFILFKIIVKQMIGRTDYPNLLNSYQCESHRWMIEMGSNISLNYLNNKQ